MKLTFTKRINNKIIFILMVSSMIYFGVVSHLYAVETSESLKDAYQFYLSNLNRKYINEKITTLLTTEWSQTGSYAMDTPTKVRVGCWSLAIAQILYYHRLLPEGIVGYKCSHGARIHEDLESFQFHWNLFVNKMDDNTPADSIEQIAKYCYFTAVVLRYDFGSANYLLNDDEHTLRHMVEKFYPCKVEKFEFKEHSFGNRRKDIIRIIKNEINASRPVMFYIESKNLWVTHAVVIDGYLEKEGLFLVHINQGLGGEGNGSFNLFDSISRRDDDRERRVLIAIKPTR